MKESGDGQRLAYLHTQQNESGEIDFPRYLQTERRKWDGHIPNQNNIRLCAMRVCQILGQQWLIYVINIWKVLKKYFCFILRDLQRNEFLKKPCKGKKAKTTSSDPTFCFLFGNPQLQTVIE